MVGGPAGHARIARSPTSSSRTASSWARRRRWRSCRASRARGATLTAGLLLGLERAAAARFSFLLSIPAVVLSGLYQAYELAAGKTPGDTGAAEIVVATILAFITGYAAIAFLLRYLVTHNLSVFVAYRIALGLIVIGLAASGAIS